MLAETPEKEKHKGPKRHRKEVDCLVDADAQQTGDDCGCEIKTVMIAEQRTWLVKVTRRVGAVLQVRYNCVVLIEISLIMKIEQDCRKDDRYGRESGNCEPTR